MTASFKISTSLLLVLLTGLNFNAHSQAGTYDLGPVPTEAIQIDSTGAFLYPIYIGTTTIKLKRTRRAIVIYDEDEMSEVILKGKWSKEGDLITIRFPRIATYDDLRLTLVEYKSGIYLKKTDQNMHYKLR